MSAITSNEACDPWINAADDLHSMAAAFMDSHVLIVAAELDVFSHLARGLETSGDLAVAIDRSELPTRLLLNALCALGLVWVEDGRYRLNSRYRGLLLDGPRTMLPCIRGARMVVNVFEQLADVMTGRVVPPPEFGRSVFMPNRGRDLALVTFNYGAAASVVDELLDVIAPARRVLDLGGGDGSFAAAVLARSSPGTYTILDQPGEHPVRQHLAAELASGRLQLVEGDARTMDWKAEFDLVVLNELVELFTREEKQLVTQLAFDALVPGGRLVTTKFHLAAAETQPVGIAFLSFTLSLMRRGVYLESDAEMAEVVWSAGFRDVAVRRFGIKCAVVATKPHMASSASRKPIT